MTNRLFAPPALGTVQLLTGLPGGSDKIHDGSPYQNIGTITGATWKRLPSGLWYLYFDGTDDVVDCGARASLTITTENFSFIWWMNLPAGWNTDHRSPMGGADNSAGVGINLNTGKPELTKVGVGSATASNTALTPDVWEMRVIVHDNTKTTNNVWYYYNGVPDGIQSFDVDFVGAVRYVGSVYRAGAFDNPFKGGIALPRILKGVVLSALDVEKLFNQEKHLFGVW